MIDNEDPKIENRMNESNSQIEMVQWMQYKAETERETEPSTSPQIIIDGVGSHDSKDPIIASIQRGRNSM